MFYCLPSFIPDIGLLEKIKNIQQSINQINSFRDRGLSDSLRAKIYKQIRTSHVYNSNAIEGNLLTLRETEVILDNLELNDKPLKDQIEAKTLGVAFDLLVNLINGNEKISKKTILDLHSILMHDVDSTISGKWRDIDVKISQAKHIPPCWADVGDHIDKMLEWYNTDNTYSIAVKACILHHWFTWIHPFQDGNGRIARLLLNFSLMQSGYPEVIIRIEDRTSYYDSLSYADSGDITSLVDLVTDKILETTNMYNEFINEEQREKEWIAKYQRTGFERRIETERYNYEVWKSSIEVFAVRFQQLVNSIKNSIPDVLCSYKYYDILTFNKYLDMFENRDVSNTWFFTLKLSKLKHEDLLIVFYFERFYLKSYQNGRRYRNNTPIIKLYYSFKRSGDNLPVDTSIDLYNVGVNKDKLVFGVRDGQNRNRIVNKESLPGEMIRAFLDQVLQRYFKI